MLIVLSDVAVSSTILSSEANILKGALLFSVGLSLDSF